MKRLRTTMLGTGLVFLASATQATTFNNNSGLSSPDQTINFESATLGFNVSVTNQFEQFGVTFTDAFGNPDGSSYPNITGNRIGNFEGGISFHPDFSMLFTKNLSAVAFAMVAANGGEATAVAYLDGVAVESFVFNTSTTNSVNYYGFRNAVFDEVQIGVVSFDNAFLIDNLQTAAVPEPSTCALLLAGLGSIGAAVRRQSRR
jgi:hypothetical protein